MAHPRACTSPAGLILLAVLLFPAVQACSVPPGGCMLWKCTSLASLKAPVFGSGNTQPWQIGRYAGGWNQYWNTTILANGTNVTNSFMESQRGGPFVNYEIFTQVDATYLISSSDAQKVKKLSDCCSLCAGTAGCTLYQFFTSASLASIQPIFGGDPAVNYTFPSGFVAGQQCYLLTGGSDKSLAVDLPYGTPFSGTKTQQKANNWIAPSWVGGFCNPNASITNDPHFTGAYGTRFDFNGDVGKVFTLLTDEGVHLNIRLGGYLDDRTTGATVLPSGKAIRTWIQEIGLLWVAPDGSRHSLVLSARKGSDVSKPEGYLSAMVLDGKSVPVPEEGSPMAKDGLSVQATGLQKRGPFDVATFQVHVEGLLEMALHLRPAHPLLRTESNAYVHFNVQIGKFEPTRRVHGILGQTFRNSGVQVAKALEYQVLTALLRQPIAADGQTGAGFLEGKPSDYEVPDILSTRGRFSAWAS